ncbi:MAG TPA: hypothetical protein VKG45_15825 [Actinomycetes bacterium]|nr:hypothetical protein [Actinomycetes bacterium]
MPDRRPRAPAGRTDHPGDGPAPARPRAPAGPIARRWPARPRVVAGLIATLGLAAALAARTAWAFGDHRRAAADTARLEAPAAPGDVVVRPLRPAAAAAAAPAPSGTLRHRPGGWLTVVDLRGLAPLPGGDRYLTFVRCTNGWILIGGARPGPTGAAQVRYRAAPRPDDVFEVMVTAGVDTADPGPHGRLLLRWVDPDIERRFQRQPWPVAAVPARSGPRAGTPRPRPEVSAMPSFGGVHPWSEGIADTSTVTGGTAR